MLLVYHLSLSYRCHYVINNNNTGKNLVSTFVRLQPFLVCTRSSTPGLHSQTHTSTWATLIALVFLCFFWIILWEIVGVVAQIKLATMQNSNVRTRAAGEAHSKNTRWKVTISANGNFNKYASTETGTERRQQSVLVLTLMKEINNEKQETSTRPRSRSQNNQFSKQTYARTSNVPNIQTNVVRHVWIANCSRAPNMKKQTKKKKKEKTWTH